MQTKFAIGTPAAWHEPKIDTDKYYVFLQPDGSYGAEPYFMSLDEIREFHQNIGVKKIHIKFYQYYSRKFVQFCI